MSKSMSENMTVLYNMWFKPISGATHADRLDSFYNEQASAYDNYRENFLHGRKPMLQAAAGRLEDQKDLVWLDMGGGTGWNVETMESILGGLHNFKKIYIIDLCKPLCEVAQKRVNSKGWKNVEVINADVCEFKLPEDAKASFISFSYSLSMIPPFYAAVDNALSLLTADGLFGVADFYVSEKYDTATRQNSTFNRIFWKSVFDFDGIYLDPARRLYLDHKMQREYEFNSVGKIPFVPLVEAPYYVWLGHPRTSSAPVKEHIPLRPGKGFPKTFIYSMTWEDPAEDAKVFPMGPNDVVLSLTSGGCNLLDMLIDGPQKVVGVDLNPCQNFLVELKKVCIKRLAYEDFWKMFGEGKHENIRALYKDRIAMFLSQEAHVFWSERLHYFDECFYHYGAMGWLIYLIKYLGPVFRMDQDVKDLLEAGSTEKQGEIWDTKLRWKILAFTRLMDNPAALWVFNGVPQNQLNMLRSEGTLVQYNERVFDQAVKNSILKTENYFYRVCLTGKYTKECCPRYLKEEHFNKLKNEKLIDRLELRTDSFQNVLRSGYFSRVILMDHLDWLDRDYVTNFSKDLAAHVVRKGLIIWRSASRQPWYAQIIQDAGFNIKRVNYDNAYMDRVNMYASFYLASQPAGVEADVGYSSN